MTDAMYLRLEHVDHFYGKVHAVVDLSLDVPAGAFLTLLGPSGCGKSTTLSVIAGLERPTNGRVLLGDRDITRDPPNERGMAMVFQNYALYPHQTVYDNIAFGLKLLRLPRRDVDTRVRQAADALDIAHLLARKPGELSGGQQQRVALGRALVKAPGVFLFDEPFSNLDAALRARMRSEVKQLHMSIGATSVLVTHDQEEAMTMSSLIAVMREGRLVQYGTPDEIYGRPVNTYVAGFVGKPTMSLLTGKLETDGGVAHLGGEGTRIPLGPERQLGLTGDVDGPVVVGIRAESVTIDDHAPDTFPAVVRLLEPVGSDTFVQLTAGPHELVARVAPTMPLAVGQAVRVRLTGAVHLFDPDTGSRINR
jgi:multiple sugar transport system ATP-binding protein